METGSCIRTWEVSPAHLKLLRAKNKTADCISAYSLSTKTFFNGFAADHPVIYINSENQVNVGEESKAQPLVHVQEQVDQPMVV